MVAPLCVARSSSRPAACGLLSTNSRRPSSSRICRSDSVRGKCHRVSSAAPATQPRFLPTCAPTSGRGARRPDPGQASQRFAHRLLVAAVEQLPERHLVAVAGEAEDARDRSLHDHPRRRRDRGRSRARVRPAPRDRRAAGAQRGYLSNRRPASGRPRGAPARRQVRGPRESRRRRRVRRHRGRPAQRGVRRGGRCRTRRGARRRLRRRRVATRGSRPTRRAIATTRRPAPASAARPRALRGGASTDRRSAARARGWVRVGRAAGGTRAERRECRCGQSCRGCRRASRRSPDRAPDRRPRTPQSSAPSRDRSASACARARRARRPGPWRLLFASRRDCTRGSTEA